MALTQVMQQYTRRKEEYGDCILLFRLGDFYEMYGDDALYASKTLSLTLTSRNMGGERVPMCGMPFHAADSYIGKLVAEGKKVAICEQTNKGGGKTGDINYKEEKTNSIASREVVRVVTKGTSLGYANVNSKRNSYLCSIAMDKTEGAALAFCDMTTGEFFVCDAGKNVYEGIQELLYTYLPDEIISGTRNLYLNDKLNIFAVKGIDLIKPYFDWVYDYGFAKDALKGQFNVITLGAAGSQRDRLEVIACGSLISYLKDTQKRDLPHLQRIKSQDGAKYMSLDFSTRKNLELSKALRDGKQKGSLLSLLDNTLTPFGSRLLCKWLEAPLCDKAEIDKRLDAVGELTKGNTLALEKVLPQTADIERAAAKIAHNSYSFDDFVSIAATFNKAKSVYLSCEAFNSLLMEEIKEKLLTGENAEALFERVINIKENEFNKGYDGELNVLFDGYALLLKKLNELEVSEKALFKVKNINISRNKIFGYYIEVPKGAKETVPTNYMAKQTLSDAYRYTFPQLITLENEIKQKEWEITQKKKVLSANFREKIIEILPVIQGFSQALSTLDVLLCFANNAKNFNYTRPEILEKGGELTVIEGRHPLVERALTNSFVANDCAFSENTRIMLITGPNMAGKSTYMRQVALIAILAHAGSFVPCLKARIPLIDKIFTRIGAQDDISFNKSTFMTECVEVGNILNNATQNSLVLLDEVGRSTSADDGLAIARAVTEYLHDVLHCKTMFSTHYKELAELSKTKKNIKNFKLEAKQERGNLHFYYKVAEGVAEKSFGIEVARQSGMPASVIDRAAALIGEKV